MRTVLHCSVADPALTTKGEARGWIDMDCLRELWIHTGTSCNLQCPTCMEQAGPGDARLQPPRPDELAPYIDAAVSLGAGSIGITGGEPFTHPDISAILRHVLDRAPCLVLSNGTAPLQRCLPELASLQSSRHPLRFRISLDFPDEEQHDAGRGKGMFRLALDSIARLLALGFPVAVARRIRLGENADYVNSAYRDLFVRHKLPPMLPVVGFPELRHTGGPEISENCIRTCHSPESRARFMCAYSRMLAKQENAMRLYACTLVDDSRFHDFGPDLEAALHCRTFLAHERCFICFSSGVRCSGD